jgi:hypothetical protein
LIWAYRILAALNIPVFAVSLFLAVSILTNLFDGRSTTMSLVGLVWPLPQIAGFWAASKARGAGDLAEACWILFAQLLVIGGLSAFLTFMLLAALPE